MFQYLPKAWAFAGTAAEELKATSRSNKRVVPAKKWKAVDFNLDHIVTEDEQHINFNCINKRMTKSTRLLLAVSLSGFAIGSTGMLWGIGTPIGAVFFGLFMISKVLQKEAALFDEEYRLRLALAERNSAPASRRVPEGTRKSYRAGQLSASHSS